MRLPSAAATVPARARRITRRNFHSSIMCLRGVVVRTPDKRNCGSAVTAREAPDGGSDAHSNGGNRLLEPGFVQRPAPPGELLRIPVAERGERDPFAGGLDEPAVTDVDRRVEDLSPARFRALRA